MAELWSELIYPAELTGYAREAQAQYEQSLGTLARWLPNRQVSDIVARFFVGRTGLLPVASFRSYDAETPIGGLQGLKRMTVELPPIGQKNRIGEYDQLRQRDGNVFDTVALNSILRMTQTLVRAVSDRMEYERGKAIENGTTDISDNGFVQSADWGRSASHDVSLDWDDPATAPILDDIDAIKTQYLNDMGALPGVMVTSTRVIAKIARSNDFRALASSIAGEITMVTRETINTVLQSYGLPPFVIYDRRVNFDGTVQRILSDNKVFFLPEPVDPDDEEGTQFGGTFWGRTLESDEPDYGIEPAEQPGIVAATWKTRDPIGLWVHTNAIGLPVIANADLSTVATVLPDSS